MMFSSSKKEELSTDEKQRKHPKNPSFSSSLLHEILNSTDGNEEYSFEARQLTNQSTRKSNNDIANVKTKAPSCTRGQGFVEGVSVKVSDFRNIEKVEAMESLERACLMEKFMEQKIKQKVSSLRKIPYLLPELDNDQMFFSTSSSSSWDSSSGGLSSSDAELFYNSSTKSRTIISCFSANSSSRNNNTTQQMGDNSTNSKSKSSRALKMYNHLKKVKQPVSPGGRLTSFINSLFASGNGKKSNEVAKHERKRQPPSSNPSTSSSFSRSCFTKSVPLPHSRVKCDDIRVRKPVHLHPVIGHKSICNEECDRFKKEHVATLKLHVLERNKSIHQEKDNDDLEDVEDVERVSDSSSDLFEIDHLRDRFCEELPVYESTRLDTNLATGLKV